MPITQYNSSVRQMSQSKFDSMKNANGKIPDLANQIVMTNSEDSNISCLRTEVVYDMTSSDASKNWGYPSGIYSNTTVSNKDFSKFSALKVYICAKNNATISDDTWGRNNILDIDITSLINFEYSSSNLFRYSGKNNYFGGAFVTISPDKKSLKFLFYDGENLYTSSDKAFIYKIEGVLKTPSMIYTGDELIAGNGISLDNGTINASSMTTLWTNPNPANAFPAQTITLNSDDYDYLIIRCSVRIPYNNEKEPIWQTYMIKKGDTSFRMFIIITASTSEYRGEMMDRIANNITPTSIHFENAGYMQNSTTNSVGIDYVMIPQQVIGVKVV